MRVAAYCRVSTEHEDQLNSLESQKKYFTEYIEKSLDWKLVGVYADEGITGTSTAKRTAFNKMIHEAIEGNIDVIVTKEVSRFARNTVDTLFFTRQLSAKGVRVIFINDNIDTKDKDSEFRLTIMASVAQEESRKTSERVKWGMNRKMERGFAFLADMIGYDVKNGMLYVNHDEAEAIRIIFYKYVYEGKGLRVISQELNDEGVPVAKRIKKWTKKNISDILSNEKYVGDLLQKKYCTPNYLDHKLVRNKGIEEQIYLKAHHEPIIDRDTWELAQAERKRRGELGEYGTKYSNRYWASGKIECAECGGKAVSRNKYNKNGSLTRFWYCKEGYTYGKARKTQSGNKIGCDSSLINDRALVLCVQFALQQLDVFDGTFIEDMYRDIVTSQLDEETEDIKPLERKLAVLIDKKSKIIDWCLDGSITKEEMQQMKAKYDNEISILKKKIEKINSSNKLVEDASNNLSVTLEAMKKIARQEEPTAELYSEIVDKIVLRKDHDLDIYFKYIRVPINLHYTTSGRGDSYHVECELIKNRQSEKDIM